MSGQASSSAVASKTSLIIALPGDSSAGNRAGESSEEGPQAETAVSQNCGDQTLKYDCICSSVMHSAPSVGQPPASLRMTVRYTSANFSKMGNRLGICTAARRVSENRPTNKPSQVDANQVSSRDMPAGMRDGASFSAKTDEPSLTVPSQGSRMPERLIVVYRVHSPATPSVCATNI